MLGVHEGADATLLLGFRHDLERQRGFAGRFGAVDLDHAPARQTADAQGNIQTEGAGGNGLHVHVAVVGAQPHDRALAEVLVDLGKRSFQRLLLVHDVPFDHPELWSGHKNLLIP